MIKGRPAEFQFDALKLAGKTFVSEVESFLITSFEKCFYIIFGKKEKKKVIFGQIGLEFSARHDQTVSCKIF